MSVKNALPQKATRVGILVLGVECISWCVLFVLVPSPREAGLSCRVKYTFFFFTHKLFLRKRPERGVKIISEPEKLEPNLTQPVFAALALVAV